jgi:hypothetical protein
VAPVRPSCLRCHELRRLNANVHPPQAIGNIAHWHRTLKDGVALAVHISPDQLRQATARFVDYYSQQRYYDALHNVTSDGVYRGRREVILARRAQLRTRIVVARRHHCRQTHAGIENAEAGTTKVSPSPGAICATKG